MGVKLMYQVNSKPDHLPPPGDRWGFTHSSCPWRRVFTLVLPVGLPGVCSGVLNQSKGLIILKKARFLLCLLNKKLYRAFSRQANGLTLNISVLQGLLRVNGKAEKDV